VRLLLLIAVAVVGLFRPQSPQPTAAPCEVSRPTAELSIPHVAGAPALSTDPSTDVWRRAQAASIVRDCTRTTGYPDLATEVRGFWTDTDVYFLFVCPYRSLNLFLPAQPDRPRHGLWDRDVVELFLGDDWTNIRRYREFEIAPTGDWIDLAIDLDRRGPGPPWSSGWQAIARIDAAARRWYAACRIPLRSVSDKAVVAGTRWRANLYRLDGEGPDSVRRFMCWQPTCVTNRDPNHVPENFGTLTFAR
jgi:hypothetical protein